MKTGRLLFLFLLVLLQPLFFGAPLCGQEQLSVTHGPYLIDPAADAMTMVWFTSKPCLSWVEYCGDKEFGVFPVWGGYPQTAKAGKHGLIEANTTRHVIRVPGLDPGKVYRYRICSKEILRFNPYEVLYGDTIDGEVLEFSTLDPSKETFSFGVITDVHERGDELDTLLQKTALDSLDMIFYNGDILNWIGDEERIFNGFLDVSINRFAQEKPFIFVRGNHETRGWGARGLFDYFPHSSGRFYYTFIHGGVCFIVMDSGEDKPDDHPVYAGLVDFDRYRDEQRDWLAGIIRTPAFKEATYRIVLVHIPPYSGSEKHGAEDITKKWGPLFEEGKVDLIISGHHHRYTKIDRGSSGNNPPVLIVDKDMIMNTEVSKQKLFINIIDIDGQDVDGMTVPAHCETEESDQ